MSGTDQTKVIYWDSCVYIAWLRDEQSHGKAPMDAIAQVLKENFERKVTIISSTITLIEVLASKMDEEKERLFRKSFRTRDHIAYDVDIAIALKARELRDRLLNQESGKLATPDAIHIATALIYKARALFTFDSRILVLNKDPRVGGLEISQPVVDQPELIP
jgi:predicted nucleic acid-binding protein